MFIDNMNAELIAALSKAQGEITNAAKNAKNPHFKSDYADLAAVLNTVKPALSKHGIALVQGTAFDGSMVTVTTVLAHSSGGSVSSEASCVPAKMDGQGIGSATTYLRRYSLAAMCGIAQQDLDGEDSKHNTTPPPPARKPRKKPNVPQKAVEATLENIAAGKGTPEKAIEFWSSKYTVSDDLKKLLHDAMPEGVE